MERSFIIKDLSIIIVSYNTKKITMECIDSVISSGAGKYTYEIIVVDNASSDGSYEEIFSFQSKTPSLQVLKNSENLGFSKANNSGVKVAKGRYILFLNSDTIVHPGTLETMISFMDAQKDAGAATCKVILPSGSIDDASHRGFPTPWNALCHFSGISKVFPHSRFFSGYSLGWMDLDKTHTIDALAGCFMIVRKEAGEKLGWWDEDFFWYGDDLDFCYRLHREKWNIYYVPTVSILHYKGVSGGIKQESKALTKATYETKKRAQVARFDAMKLFYQKHYLIKYPMILTRVVFFAIWLKRFFVVKSIRKNNTG